MYLLTITDSCKLTLVGKIIISIEISDYIISAVDLDHLVRIEGEVSHLPLIVSPRDPLLAMIDLV